MVIRAFTAECPSTIPRPERVEDFDPARDYCESDADCTEQAHGYCTKLVIGPTGSLFHYACQYGCVDDGECGSGSICVCGDPVGSCNRAHCASSSECADGFDCALTQGLECTPDSFTCQRSEDQCATNLDCMTDDGGYMTCGVEAGGDRRICSGGCAPSH